MTFDHSNIEFKQVLEFVNTTNTNIFLSGKAGTGKTTFLKSLKDNTYKNLIIAASTGVAAINSGGVTIHSLLQIPLTSFTPNKFHLLEEIRLDSKKRSLLQQLELLVIDEVSMIRADTLDAIDFVLRRIREKQNTPFGGIQLLYIGDLFQLSPVVSKGEWEQLKQLYKSPFFIDSKVFRQTNPVHIELNKVYRQSDEEFISILNNIRVNEVNDKQLIVLNNHYFPDLLSQNASDIILTTHNDKADSINSDNLNCLEGIEYNFIAEIVGKFDQESFPAEKMLKLKIGARIMLLKNDSSKEKKFFNGKIGTLTQINDNSLTIGFDHNQTVEIQRETWNNIDYNYDIKSNEFIENIAGSFKQFPIRLAWAITIHKSQGLTFENAIVDIEDAFAPGQVYVALSRIRSLQGLKLGAPITPETIKIHPRLIELSALKQISKTSIVERLKYGQHLLTYETILKHFDWSEMAGIVNTIKPLSDSAFDNLRKSIEYNGTVTDKFKKEIDSHFSEDEIIIDARVYSRTATAATYFIKEIDEKGISPVKEYLNKIKDSFLDKKTAAIAKDALKVLERQKQVFVELKELSNGLISGKSIGECLKDTRSSKIVLKKTKEKQKKDDDATETISLRMFKERKSIIDIAKERNLSIDTIEHHLSKYIKSGEINILDILAKELLEEIINLLQEDTNLSLMAIRQRIGDYASFGQIGAAIEYWRLKNGTSS